MGDGSAVQLMTGGGTAPAIQIDDAARKRIRFYFERRYEPERRRLHSLGWIKRLNKLSLAMIGVCLLIACGAAAYATWTGHEWFRGLEIYELSLGVIAAILVFFAWYIGHVEVLPTLEEVEREVVAALDQDIQALLSKVAELVPGPDSQPAKFDLKLIGYPDKPDAQQKGLFVGSHVGTDKKSMRFTPAVVLAAVPGPRSVVLYEGSVDLTTGKMCSERVIEAAYAEITMIERSSIAPKLAEERDGARKIMLPRRRPQAPLRDRDTIAIHLANGQSVKVVLRDVSFADGQDFEKLPLSEDQDKIEAFWKGLRSHWLAALEARSA